MHTLTQLFIMRVRRKITKNNLEQNKQVNKS